MFCQLWQNAILQQEVLTFGCQNMFMSYLTLWLIFWELNGHQKMLHLVFFEFIDTSRKSLAKKLVELVKKNNLRKNSIVYLKDERFNLNTMNVIWKAIVRGDILDLAENYWGTCFGHAFSKAYQYVTIDENIYKDLTYVYIKTMQRNMQKCKTWP